MSTHAHDSHVVPNESQIRLKENIHLADLGESIIEGPKREPKSPINDQNKSDFRPGWRLYSALFSLCTVILVVALDATSLSVALPIISHELGGTAIEAFWSGTSFLLTSTVFQPNFASLSHIFGRKPLVCYTPSFMLLLSLTNKLRS